MRIIQKGRNVKVCKECGVELIVDINWAPSKKKGNYYLCSRCSTIKSNNWRKNNPEKVKIARKKCFEKHKVEYLKNSKNYRRENILTTTDENGKSIFILVKKRKHTLVCELCNKEVKRTSYHHWDDVYYENGLWVCGLCHTFCEKVDGGLVNKYLILKEKIERKEV